VNDVVEEELERARVLAEGKPVRSAVRASCRLVVEAPEKVLSVLLGNLPRNAFSYTDAGEVTVDIDPGVVVIRDSGDGIAPEKVGEMYRPFVREDSSRRGGHGVGLTIVKRLSDRFGWPVTIESQPGIGTRVEVRFPGPRVEPNTADAAAGFVAQSKQAYDRSVTGMERRVTSCHPTDCIDCSMPTT
jgi:signal transduction histidine kinase